MSQRSDDLKRAAIVLIEHELGVSAGNPFTLAERIADLIAATRRDVWREVKAIATKHSDPEATGDIGQAIDRALGALAEILSAADTALAAMETDDAKR